MLQTISHASVIKRKIKGARHTASMGEKRGAYWVLVGKPEKINHLEDPGAIRKIIRKWTFKT
jgi:hypothetical protein